MKKKIYKEKFLWIIFEFSDKQTIFFFATK